LFYFNEIKCQNEVKARKLGNKTLLAQSELTESQIWHWQILHCSFIPSVL